MQKVLLKPPELLFDAILFGYFYIVMYKSNSQITSWIKSLVHRFSVLNSWLISGAFGLLVLLAMVLLLTRMTDFFTQYPQLSTLKWFAILYALGAVFYVIMSPSLIEFLSARKTDASLALLVFLIVLPALTGVFYGIMPQISSSFDFYPWFKALSEAFFFLYLYVLIPLILIISVLLAKIQDPDYAWLIFSAVVLMRVGAIFYNLKISYLNIVIMLVVLALDLYITVNNQIVV